MSKSTSQKFRKTGFSLVEMMVAMAVFSILMVMVSQMLKSAVMMAALEHKRMDSEDQARLVFSRMAVDFAKMVKRNDVDSLFAINPQGAKNDAFYIYSEAPAQYDTTNDTSYMYGASTTAYNATTGNCLLKNSLSLVGYRINSNTNQLERLGKSLNFDSINNGPFAVFLTFPPVTPSNPTPTPLPTSMISGLWSSTVGGAPAYASGSDTDYHILGNGVFRMAVCFQLSTGYCSQSHTTKDFSDVSSIVVTLAVLDQTSRALISGNPSSVLSTAASQLPYPPSDSLGHLTSLPAQTWFPIVDASSSFAASTGMPMMSASQVRIYQQYFYLNSLR